MIQLQLLRVNLIVGEQCFLWVAVDTQRSLTTVQGMLLNALT
jgi:hypothetical protein